MGRPAGPLNGRRGVRHVPGLLEHVHRRLVRLREQAADCGTLRDRHGIPGHSQVTQEGRQVMTHTGQRG